MKKQKLFEYIFIAFMLLLGYFIRSYNFNDYFSFSPELADNLFEINTYDVANTFPLVGPSTSHPWLKFGPIYYWIMMPIMRFFNWSPLAAGYLGVIVGTLVTLINYIYVSKLFSRKVAYISSFLISLSPLWINYSRDARFYFLAILFFYPFFYYLTNYFKKGGSNLQKSVFFWGLMLNFHLSLIVYLPVFIYVFLKRKDNVRSLLKSIFILLITQMPLLLYDFKSNFFMLKQFILWVPYRLAGFFNLYPKNNPNIEGLTKSADSFLEFVGSSFINIKNLWILIFMIIIFIFVKSFKRKKLLLINISLSISVISIFVHGDSPLHYLLPITPLLPIIFAEYIENLNIKILCFIFLIIFLANFRWYFSEPKDVINISMQRRVTEAILKNMHNQKYSLKRVGKFDYFDKYFAQNYLYLLWLNGSFPDTGGNLIFTIYENDNNYKNDNIDEEKVDKKDIIFRENNLIVTKEVLKCQNCQQ